MIHTSTVRAAERPIADSTFGLTREAILRSWIKTAGLKGCSPDDLKWDRRGHIKRERQALEYLVYTGLVVERSGRYYSTEVRR
jgi:hypothetical protein